MVFNAHTAANDGLSALLGSGAIGLFNATQGRVTGKIGAATIDDDTLYGMRLRRRWRRRRAASALRR